MTLTTQEQKTKERCKTQWHLIVAYLWQRREWVPTFELQSKQTDFGFIGSSGEQRVRELTRDNPELFDRYPELEGKIEKKRVGKYEYFRYRRSSSRKEILAFAAQLVRDFDNPKLPVFA